MNTGQERGVLSLEQFCQAHRKVALAFSGGCDSSYLLSVLVDAGIDVGVYVVKTAFQANFEIDDALRVSRELEQKIHLIEADILIHVDICTNPPDRCYFCKKFIFENILDRMTYDGYEILLDGTNASDDPSRRPGFRALEELGVISPLRLAGMTKEDVREASERRGLSTFDKPSFSCLATKIEAGHPITQEGLTRVEQDLVLPLNEKPKG